MSDRGIGATAIGLDNQSSTIGASSLSDGSNTVIVARLHQDFASSHCEMRLTVRLME